MDKERFRTRCAVLLLLLRQQGDKQQILLQRRQNTGYADGHWDTAASGHLEARESLKQAMAREAAEELGIRIQPAELRFVTLIHKYIPSLEDAYFNVYFLATTYSGQEHINEPEKCSELCWFDVDKLPDDLIADRRLVLQHYLHGVAYDEYGWQDTVENI